MNDASASDDSPAKDSSPSDGSSPNDMSVPPPTCDPGWACWPMPNPPSTGLPNPQDYDAERTDVIVDRVTGLEWQRALSAEQFSWSDALAYCDALVLAGYEDWRLPSRIELVSIVDFTRSYPAVDSDVFSAAPTSTFWTASPVAGVPNIAKNVNMEFGSVYYDDVSTPWGCGVSGRSRSTRMPSFSRNITAISVLAVGALVVGDLGRDTHAEAPAGRYVVTDETVVDTITKLTWQRVVQDPAYLGRTR